MSRLTLMLVLFISCLAAPTLARAPDPTLAGFGDSNAAPAGEPFQLPPGIELAGPIKGHAFYAAENCSPEEKDAKGSGGMVQICMPIRYPSETASQHGPRVVTFPGGLIFTSEDLKTQNGFLIREVSVEIRPGETIYIPMYLMCLNNSRSGSHPGSIYRLGPVTNNAAFRQFVRTLETKQLPVTTSEGDGMGVAYLQDAVWSLSRGEPINARTQAAIDALPDEQ